MREELLELPIDPRDAEIPGGHIVAAADWQPRAAPAVVVVHGVAGSSDDAYVVRAARALAHRGYHVLRINQRGSGRGHGKAAHLYHAGLGDDVGIVCRFLEARDDVTGVGVLGFSLGGHTSLAHAAAVGADVGKLKAVASISSPVDLAASMLAFDRARTTPARFYERKMLAGLVAAARALGARAPFSDAELAAVADIRQFDALVTCRCHGFADVDEYYAKSSVLPKLGAIHVPTLVIHAEDDPIVPVGPLQEALGRGRTSGALHGGAVDVVILPRGGHVGFVGSLPQLWGATAAVELAATHFATHLLPAL